MKAIVYSDWGKLTLQDIERPKISEDEVLIQVSRVGVCGSELQQFSTRDPRRTPPLILGHEFSGVVVDLGSEVERISLGWLLAGIASSAGAEGLTFVAI